MNKRALVIGNSAYPGKSVLKSPRDDAQEVASSLKQIDFEVTVGLDLTYDKLVAVIDEFVQSLRTEQSDVTLLYYSGHGVQLQDNNFLVPIDFDDDEDTLKFYPVQDIIDQISTSSALQLVLLDACRSNFDPGNSLNTKAIRISPQRAIRLTAKGAPATGLAEMRTSASTFIAFAASPGDVAYDGQGTLSPFTEAFVKYVDVVDLPLSNLMNRVRQEVLVKTGGRQRTWDQSSLMTPFYFSPGSMFLFMGNVLALLGLFISIATYSFILSSPESTPGWIALAAVAPIISLGILMFGMQSVYSRLRGNSYANSERPASVWRHVLASLQKGLLGGYLGSLIAGLGIAFSYYRDWLTEYNACIAGVVNGQSAVCMDPPEPFGNISLEITIAAAFVASTLGVLTLISARVGIGRKGFELIQKASTVRTFVGATIGGALTGLLTAPLVTLYFAQLARPILMPKLLLPGSIAGAAFIVFSIVNFDFERLSLRRLLVGGASALASLLAGALISLALFVPIHFVGFDDGLVNWMRNPADDAHFLGGGAVYGFPAGITLGIIIATAITLTERWSGKPIFWRQRGDRSQDADQNA